MLARYRDPRVVPLEVWDLLVDGAPLHSVPRDGRFGHALARGVDAIVAGAAISESGERFPDECHEIAQVVLTGGGAHNVEWAGRIPAQWTEDGAFCAEAGGRAILAREGGSNGVVVDLGQSRLKISARDGRVVLPRDLEAIPLTSTGDDLLRRDALVAFVAEPLRSIAAREPVEAIVLGLPCSIAPNGALGPCTYPWRADDGIVSEILNASGLAEVHTWLVNDAELAAIGVASKHTHRGVSLVLTIGFGVGGALVRGGR